MRNEGGLSRSVSPMNGPTMLARWEKLGSSRLGRMMFSRALGLAVPYTGSIKPRVLDLAAGRARVELRDRRAVRNHLGSIHAIALVNLGEVTSGLALIASLPPTKRGIVRGLSVEYLKKARGTLTASCECEPPLGDGSVDMEVVARISDAEGEVVSIVRVQWRIGPTKAAPPAEQPA